MFVPLTRSCIVLTLELENWLGVCPETTIVKAVVVIKASSFKMHILGRFLPESLQLAPNHHTNIRVMLGNKYVILFSFKSPEGSLQNASALCYKNDGCMPPTSPVIAYIIYKVFMKTW